MAKYDLPSGATPRQSLAGFLEARIDLEDAALRDGFERLLLQLGPLLADPARLEAALELLDRADEAIGILDAQAQWAEAFQAPR